MSSRGPLLPVVPDMDAYRKVYKDPETWLPAMREICSRHGLNPEELYAETTGTNAVFRVAGGPWIKLFPPLWEEDFVREQIGLHAVADVAGLSAPTPLEEGHIEDWPYLIMSHVEGQAIGQVWRDIGLEAQIELGEQMGQLMAQLHRGDLSACGPINEDWDTFMRERRQTTAERNRKSGLREDWMPALEAYIERAAAVLDRPFEPVFLHADLTDDHFFVKEQEGRWRVTGLIDFGDAMVGDPLYEFAAPAMFLSQRKPEVQRAMLQGYGLPNSRETTERIRAWTVLHRFGLVKNGVRFGPEPAPETFDSLLRSLWEATPTSP